jgi:hypothetical protein
MVVLAIFGFSNLSNRGPEGPPTAESGKPPATSGKTESTQKEETSPYSPCMEIADRLRRLVNDSGFIKPWKLPDSCYKSPKSAASLNSPKAWPDVEFAIAMVPNPVSTHLPLMFDRIVETIQQAVQDDHFIYDDSWFPWEAATRDYILLGDQLTAEARRKIQQAQPGVMVFRGTLTSKDDPPPYQRGLVIFLVAEKPTGGISDDEFENALSWIDQFGGFASGQRTLRVLGPTFSGSLPSLQRVLEPHLIPRMSKPYIGALPTQVFSGTVSSRSSYEWFNKWRSNLPTPNRVLPFQTALENDSLMVDRFCQYLRSQGYELARVGILSEDETAFGGATIDNECYDPSSGGAFYLYYPRDIATLRSAYEQQSIFSSEKAASSANTPSTTLRGDISEPKSGEHDTVRSYGEQLTPLGQESVLLQITSLLKENQTQFIILRGTSSLDQIFLSEFLRRSYPEGRVVIDGADLLFSRHSEGKLLRGVMLLSTYPLLTWQQDWTSSLLNKRSGIYRTFSEDLSEGIYIAARELFRDPGPPKFDEVPIHDYAPPAWAVTPQGNSVDDKRPATWIAVISHRQFWPVAALNSNTRKGNKAKWASFVHHFKFWPFNRINFDSLNDREREISLPSPSGTVLPVLDYGDAMPLRIPTAMWIFLIACFFWGVVHSDLCWHGSIIESPSRAYFAPVPRWQHPALIALGCLLFAMLAVTIAGASGFFSWCVGAHPFLSGWTGILLALWILAIFGVLLFGCKKNYELPVMDAGAPEATSTKQWQRLAIGSAIICFVVFALVHIIMVGFLTPANRIPAYWRGVNLLSGVSPLLPQLLLILGMYLWFWFTLRGLAHFGKDRPLLPKLENLPKLKDGITPAMPMFSREGAGEHVEDEAVPFASTIPSTKQYLLRLSVLLMITIGACALALQGFWLRTLGERKFGGFMFFWICLCIGVILADTIQLWRVWSELRNLLIYLDRLPLRRTVRALKGLDWGSIWKLSGNVLTERYRVISLQLESVRHLENTVKAWLPKGELLSEKKGEVLRKIENVQAKLDAFVEWYVTLPGGKPVDDLSHLREFQDELASSAGLVMTNIVLPAWQTETDSLIFGRSGCERKGDEGRGTGLAVPSEKFPPHVRAAEEFFVLPYLAFIQNVFGRIRTIVLGIVWLFVCTTLAVSSYPFDPLNVLGGIFLTVFVVVGGVTVLMYSQMSRDATLSHITNTTPGELGGDFWMQLLTFGIGPLLGLLTTLFPSIADFVFSWLQPGTQAFK